MDLSGDVSWDHVAHAYGPAVDVPGWIAGLRDPARAAECLGELFGSITHQGTRYSATPLCVPLLVEAAQDRTVLDRVGVVFLIQGCGMGDSGAVLAWESQRDRQAGRYERASWDAVVAEHGRLRELLADSDRAVVRAALTILAWTGDASAGVLAAIRSAIESGDGRDQCTGWLGSVVLGQLPAGVTPPLNLTDWSEVGRFGAAVAALRFAGAAAPPGAVDELCSSFASVEAGEALSACEFLMPEVPTWMAAAALGEVPAHLRGHTNAQLLIAIGRGFVLGTEPLRAYLRLNLGEHRPAAAPITLSDEAREALTRLLKPLRGWRNAPTVGHRIHELGEYGLPGTRDQLAAWLRTDHLAVALDPDKQRFPTAEDESRLWAMVEAAWARRGPEVSRARHALAARATRSVADISIVGDALTVFLLMLTWQCRGLTGDELIGLDRVVERKLYDIDQAAIQAITGGSDDGFLYARGFTIAMGRDFYHAVACDPQIAVPGSECERMCYFFAHLHRIRFGQFPYTGSGISRESGSNPAGWPD